MLGLFRVTHLVVGALALGAAGASLPLLPAAAQEKAHADSPDHALVASVQELLGALGYDPGPADGMAGYRTRRAIAAFQRSAGLPADGRPTEALFERMTAALNREAAVQPPAAPDPPTPSIDIRLEAIEPAAGTPSGTEPETEFTRLVGTSWRIEDESGAGFEIGFEPDGGISGVNSPRFWKWQQIANEVRIVYDSGWDARVVRSGRLDGGRMTGTAQGGDGREWAWRATRLGALADNGQHWAAQGR